MPWQNGESGASQGKQEGGAAKVDALIVAAKKSYGQKSGCFIMIMVSMIKAVECELDVNVVAEHFICMP